MDNRVLIILIIGGALSVTLFSYALIMLIRATRMQTQQRLINIRTQSEDSESLGGSMADRPPMPIGQRLITALGNIADTLRIGQRGREEKRLKLQRAGIIMKPQELSGVKFVTGLLVGLIILLFTRNILMGIIGLVLGFLIPEIFVSGRVTRRAQKLNEQLPEALNVIANGIRAGFSFTQAVQMVVREMEGPIADEFGRLLRENSLGKPMDEALMNLSERTADEDLDIVVTALLIQRQVGGSLAEILDSISATIRERVKLKEDVKTMTSQGKFSAIIVSVMPFAMAVLLNLVNPGYMSIMFESTIGRIVLVLAVLFIVVAIFLLSRIIKIDI